MHRLITPTARVLMATVILFTGAGVSAVFWKMPTSAGTYELYRADIADKNLAAVPLPSESVAAISSEEMGQIVLPAFAPVVDTGMEKYAQIYEAPASLAAFHTEQPAHIPASSPVTRKFEPMRQIIEEKSISIEPVNRDFPAKPVSIDTTEKSDELRQRFQFAENSKAELEHSMSEQPADPFAKTAPPTSSLQPLQPLQFAGLSPLLPLQENDLPPLSAATVK